jgi:hypothetical protein
MRFYRLKKYFRTLPEGIVRDESTLPAPEHHIQMTTTNDKTFCSFTAS